MGIVGLFGDIDQLPPVKDKVFYDEGPCSSTKSDGMGKIKFTNFLNPINEEEEESTVVLLDEVL